VRLLLDTNALLFWGSDSPSLTARARRAIEERKNTCFVSLVTAWELAIKASIGKITLAKPVRQFFAEQLSANGFDVLSIELAHVSAVQGLPFHHKDPFDRLLAAQAIEERLTVVSADPIFKKYGVKRIW
jgi:PIN domain nuclease of toxin-antitoxin system